MGEVDYKSIGSFADYDKLQGMLDEIEPILNKYGFSWGTFMGSGDFGHYNVHIMPKDEVYEP